MPQVQQTSDIQIGDLVAVYGSLRSGLHNHSVLGNSEFIGESVVHGFKMIKYSSSFPAVTPSDSVVTADRESGEPMVANTIITEVYKVTTEADAVSLDWLEGYPSFYDRKKVSTEHGDAWVYFIQDLQGEVIEDGDWKKFYLGSSL